jgi:hypothetical protein
MSERLVRSPHSFLLTLQSTEPPIRLAPVALSLDKMRPELEVLLNSYHRLMSRLKSLQNIRSYSTHIQDILLN